MSKIKNNVWNVLGLGFKLYFQNIGKFCLYMLLPTFGPLLGTILIFGLLMVAVNYQSVLLNVLTIKYYTILVFLLMLPGLIIMLKSVWELMVAYGALNSMTEALLTNGKLYDIKSHKDVITQRTFKYVVFLLCISILLSLSLLPFFWIIGAVFFVYFILVYQVFTFEKDAGIIQCFKRSFNLIKGNFARTFLIMIILGLISNYLLPILANYLFEVIKINYFFRGYLEMFAQNYIPDSIRYTPLEIANGTIYMSTCYIVSMLTLPLRSAVWTIWYKNLSSRKK